MSPQHTVNGLRLNVVAYGTGDPLLLLHGFTGSAAAWEPLAPTFTEAGFGVLAVDLVGHGGSEVPRDPARYAMERCVHDLVMLLDVLGAERAAVLGYSMGGRVALHLAAAAPERVARLALESASPGLDDPSEAEARRVADERLADDLLAAGLPAFVERWEALPLFASQARLPAAARERLRAQRLRSDPLGLANSLRGMGTGAQGSLWRELPSVRVPTLLVAGALDPRYVSVARAMAERLPDARVAIIPGAGHAVHLEEPERFAAAVVPFLTT